MCVRAVNVGHSIMSPRRVARMCVRSGYQKFNKRGDSFPSVNPFTLKGNPLLLNPFSDRTQVPYRDKAAVREQRVCAADSAPTL